MKVLVLAGGFDQIALIVELKKRTAEIVLVDFIPNPPAKKYANIFYNTSTLDVEKVKSIAISEKVDLVTTACTDQAMLTMAKVSEDLKLPCYISYFDALNATNKSFMKQRFVDNGIPTARHRIVSSTEIYNLCSFELPLVVKPVDCNSSKGVKKVVNEVELQNSIRNALKLSRTGNIVVEEYKDGLEISADVIVINGKAKVLLLTTSMKMQNSSGFTITQSIYPASISQKIRREIDKIAQNISEAFNIYNSPMLIQLIANESGINVIEFSSRIGGGTKYKLIELLTGINIMQLYVNLIFGQQLDDIYFHNNYKFAKLLYCYCKPGIFNKLINFDKLKNDKIIEDYFQYKLTGTVIEKAETSTDRLAGFIIVANTLEELIDKQMIADKKLRIIDINNNDIMMHGIW